MSLPTGERLVVRLTTQGILKSSENNIIDKEVAMPFADELIIGEGVTEISSCQFESFTSLSKVDFPTSLVRIGAKAFRGCIRLTSIRLPSLGSIGREAFANCSSLHTVVFEGRM